MPNADKPVQPPSMEGSSTISAAAFIERLEALRSDEEQRKILRYFKSGEGDVFMGVRMGQVFDLAKEFIDLPPAGPVIFRRVSH